ncbi:MAG TPA: extracellular solute-binding protein [Oscillospiraceae bacterium]|nr:extracellular solute-binding protein [Oscillospiraceae bacterium]HNW04044.1 extracellular solute-binding protein [Oscillospiraceae bacterium]
MKFQKMAALFLALLMVLLLSACGSKGSEKTDPNTLYLFTYTLSDEAQEAAWSEVFADYEAETGIKVEATYQGTWSETPELLTAAKLAGTPIDIFINGVGLIQSPLGPGAMVKDLTTLVGDDIIGRYEEGVLDSCYMGDHLWCLPLADGGCWCIVYNKAIFNELGLEIPSTFEELAHCADVINTELGITPMMINGKESWSWPGIYMSTYGEATGGQSIENVEAFLSGEKTFNGEAEIQAFDWISDLFEAGIMKADSLDTDSTGLIAAFAQEKCAMLFTLDSYVTYCEAANPDLEVGVMPYPVMEGATDYYYGYGIGDGSLCIPSFIEDDRIAMAVDFIEFVTRPEEAEKILTCDGPTKFKIFKDIDTDPSEFVAEMNEVVTPHAVTYLDWIWPAEINDAFCQGIPALVSGTITSEQACGLVQDAYDTIVQEDNYIYQWWNNFTEEEAKLVYPG